MTLEASTPFDQVLARLERVKRTSTGAQACCPAHDDRAPSLSIGLGDDSKVLIHCHAGCPTEAVMSALDLPMSLLAGTPGNAQTLTPDRPRRRGGSTAIELAIKSLVSRLEGAVEGIHKYQDKHGLVRFAVVRIRTKDGKTYRPLHFAEARWHLGDPVGPLPLYRLPEVIEADQVLVVEGEKCVDVARKFGIVATTSAHGASSASKTDWSPTGGKRITVWPDADDAGRNYVRDVATLVRTIDPDSEVRFVAPDGLPDGGDIADWVAAREANGLAHEDIAEALAVLLEGAGLWSSPTTATRSISTYSTYSAGSSRAPEWQRPCPVSKPTDPPPFPIDEAFPDSCHGLGRFIKEVAEAYQVPVDLPAMLALAAFGLAQSRTVEVAPLPDWREQLSIYVLVLLSSGERKSPVFGRMIGPIREWQRQREMSMALGIATAENNIKIAQDQLNRKRLALARHKSDGTGGESLENLIRHLADLEKTQPKAPSLIATEATTEAIGDLLVENEERGMLASPEGDALDVMLGRYNHGKPNFGPWLSGHAGDTIEIRRKGRPTLRLRRPALTVALAVQAEAITDLMNSQAAAGRGVLARFLFARPASRLGSRDLQPPPVSVEASDWYGARLHQLLDRPVPEEPALLRLSPEADRLFLTFRQSVEHELRADGKFCDHAAWGAKFAGAIARIAGVLHGIGHPDPQVTTIDCDTMRAALAWAPYLEEHERHVAWLAGDNRTTTIAERVLAWIRRHELTEFSHNEAFNGIRGSLVRGSKELDTPLAHLEELGWIRAKESLPRPGQRGRPPSRRYEVSPWALNPNHEPAPQNTHNTQKSGADEAAKGTRAQKRGDNEARSTYSENHELGGTDG